MKTTLVIPTYNEAKNIDKLISKIQSVAKKSNLELVMVFVDDNSPDKTAEVIKKYSLLNKNIHIISRARKLGLGSAYLTGFHAALQYSPDIIFEIDADLSHSPEDIPRFIANCKESDVIIGSRYIKNGGVLNWSLTRQAISRFGSFYSRSILGVNLTDLTSGYRCYKTEVIKYLLKQNIDSNGYSFQVETLFHAYKKGFRISEIPIIFKDRENGTSKFSKKIIIEAIFKIWQLKFKR